MLICFMISSELSITNLFLNNKQWNKHSTFKFRNVYNNGFVEKRPNIGLDKWILHHDDFCKVIFGPKNNKYRCCDIHLTCLIRPRKTFHYPESKSLNFKHLKTLEARWWQYFKDFGKFCRNVSRDGKDVGLLYKFRMRVFLYLPHAHTHKKLVTILYKHTYYKISPVMQQPDLVSQYNFQFIMLSPAHLIRKPLELIKRTKHLKLLFTPK
jgi:hypothetical protein